MGRSSNKAKRLMRERLANPPRSAAPRPERVTLVQPTRYGTVTVVVAPCSHGVPFTQCQICSQPAKGRR